MKRSFNEWSEK